MKTGKRLCAIIVMAITAIAVGDSIAEDGNRLSVFVDNSIVRDWVEQVAGSNVDLQIAGETGRHVSPPESHDIENADVVFLLGERKAKGGLNTLSNDAKQVSLRKGLPLIRYGSKPSVTSAAASVASCCPSDSTPVKPKPAPPPMACCPVEKVDPANQNIGIGPKGKKSSSLFGKLTGPKGEIDPHYWLDVKNAMSATISIAEILAELDPVHADFYDENSARYLAQLTTLHHWIQKEVSTLPADRHTLVTDDDTMNYFANRYGFTVAGALSTAYDSDSASGQGQETLKHLTEFVRECTVPAIFTGNINPDSAIKKIGIEAEVDLIPLQIECLGEGTPTYDAMMRNNVRLLVAALKVE